MSVGSASPEGLAAPATLTLTDEALRSELTARLGHPDWREGQAPVVNQVLAGDDLLVVRPTGSGKSLCFQLPALLLPPLTVVISPLIALMKDQVDTLRLRDPAAATCIHSGLPLDDQRQRLRDAVEGRVRMLYVAPERFRFEGFVRQLARTTVQRFVIDEAHCVSEWGHEFRPDYLALREVLPKLGDPPLIALTATATPAVQHDILAQLGRPEASRWVSGFNRPNLSFERRCAVDARMKEQHLRELLAELPGSGIVYAPTRRETEAVADLIRDCTDRPVLVYHAGLADPDRTAGQDAFMAAPDGIVVATTAFGMGIDKPDIRFVIHYALPATVESYYQQAGRAGRDGQPARCILLYDPADIGLLQWFIDQEMLSSRLLNRLLASVGQAWPPLEALANRCDCTTLQARGGLRLLEQLGCLTPLDDTGESWRATADRLPDDQAERHDSRTNERRRTREDQLDAMVYYAETGDSRRRFLLQYFGDPSLPDEAELRRDDPPPPAPDPAAVTPEETDLARLILRTAETVEHGLGRTRLAQVLKGSKAKGNERYQHLPTWGALPRWRQEQLVAAIDALIVSGLLRLVGGERPVVVPTAVGRELLADEAQLIALPPLRTMAPVLAARQPGTDTRAAGLSDDALTDDEAAVASHLQKWRTQQARAYGIAPYMVFPNTTLRALARVRPDSAEALLTIPGIGPTKAERFGPSLLEALARLASGLDPNDTPDAIDPRQITLGEHEWCLQGGRDAARRVAEAVTAGGVDWGLLLAADVTQGQLAAVAELSRSLALPAQFTLTAPDGTPQVDGPWPPNLLVAAPPLRLAALVPTLAPEAFEALGQIRLLDL